MISTPITDKNIYSPLVKVLYSTESENILKLLSADTEKFANFISTSSDEDLTSIMKLVFSPNTAISNFCLSVALKVVQLNPSISEKLFSYAGPILTMPNYESNKDAVKLHRLLLSSKGGSEVQKVPELYKNLARLVFEQKTFETVDPKGTKKFLTVQQTPRKTTVLKARRSTLSMRLDEASIGQYLAQSESDSLIEIKPTVIKPLKGFATKKRSGGLHASSGKKWFEFYPHNKCLVWRAEQTQDGIKGILFLDNSVCIDKSGNVLSIKLKDKTIQIQFENRKTLNEWYSAISTCTRSQ
ncbi:hypothetical protein GPJ56_001642 [Histomonas meleagridis]|uniref:uncharacterized protein n=1 Tax=Histomonas meleagridis TaxID=135588 RepID=UPI00355A0C57|nr:hypothetical protein GPJ56_001642 [Histomonas meleagridis]KAH0796272.1 hypothetical protein GO595_010165 [Histomonas meleagridis]